MGELARIGVALDSELLDKFDRWITGRGYTNRSEAFRDMIRDGLIRDEMEDTGAEAVGTLTLVYDHHVRLLTNRLTDVQHDHHDRILSTLHIHLDHDMCLEVLVLKGHSDQIRKLAGQLISLKGVKHGQLSLTSASATAEHSHPH
ncbi:MAG: nickel-responsive transcriptional regulator NikR [Acidobacteria bacterium]|nr:nickel-responsive transcriptional regulator NikR [Acidobacteriota bacterium]